MSRVLFDTDSDPGMQVVAISDGKLSFSCNDDWCGDSESGFGATVAIEIDREQVSELAQSLVAWLMRTGVPNG